MEATAGALSVMCFFCFYVELKITKKYQRIKGLNILKNNKGLKIKIIS